MPKAGTTSELLLGPSLDAADYRNCPSRTVWNISYCSLAGERSAVARLPRDSPQTRCCPTPKAKHCRSACLLRQLELEGELMASRKARQQLLGHCTAEDAIGRLTLVLGHELIDPRLH